MEFNVPRISLLPKMPAQTLLDFFPSLPANLALSSCARVSNVKNAISRKSALIRPKNILKNTRIQSFLELEVITIVKPPWFIALLQLLHLQCVIRVQVLVLKDFLSSPMADVKPGGYFWVAMDHLQDPLRYFHRNGPMVSLPRRSEQSPLAITAMGVREGSYNSFD